MKKTRSLRSRLLRSPTFWLMAMLITSSSPGLVRAWRVYRIGWVGNYDMSMMSAHPRPGEQSSWIHKFDEDASFSFRLDGSLSFRTASDYYQVRFDKRLFKAPFSIGNRFKQAPRLETLSIVEIKHVSRPSLRFDPNINLLPEPYPQFLLDAIDKYLTDRNWYGNLNRPLATRHEGVMPSKARRDRDGSKVFSETGAQIYSPEHAYSYYRVTGATLSSPLVFEHFFYPAWGIIKYTMPLPTAIYLFGYICYYRCFFLRRKNKRLRLGQCIKCAYPMQPDRNAPGTLCTECGYRPPDEQAP